MDVYPIVYGKYHVNPVLCCSQSADNAQIESQLQLLGYVGGGVYAVVLVIVVAAVAGMWKMFVEAA
jgi:hypothetical protein